MDEKYENLTTPYTELHADRCALLTIDVQNDYADPAGARPVPGMDEVLPRLLKVLEVFRSAGLPIVHAVRLYREDGSNVDPCRRWQFERGELRAVVAGSWGSQLPAALNPTGAHLDAARLLAGEAQELAPRESVLYKPRFSAFHATPLEGFLDSRGIDSVVIVGITFPNCVLATQLSATDRDYRVGLVPAACTQVSEDGLLAMANKGVQLMSVRDLRELLSRGESA